MNDREAMVSLIGVTKVYQTERLETVALEEVTISVPRGEFVAVMGPSGCGKSTLLHVMGLVDAPTRGAVRLAGHEVSWGSEGRLARLRNEHVGFIFQAFHLIADLSVTDNVEVPLLYRRMSGSERRKRARQAIERVGLASRADHFPAQLSGGQQQRVAIARAIAGEPSLLLADEPTGNLDSRMGGEILSLLESLNAAGTTIVMVTHDAALAQRAHRIVRLFDGRQIQ